MRKSFDSYTLAGIPSDEVVGELTAGQLKEIRAILGRMPYGASAHGIGTVLSIDGLISALANLVPVLERAVKSNEETEADLLDLEDALRGGRKLMKLLMPVPDAEESVESDGRVT